MLSFIAERLKERFRRGDSRSALSAAETETKATEVCSALDGRCGCPRMDRGHTARFQPSELGARRAFQSEKEKEANLFVHTIDRDNLRARATCRICSDRVGRRGEANSSLNSN